MCTLYLVVAFVSLAWSLPGHWEVNNCPQLCTCLIEGSLRKVYCDIQNKQQLESIPRSFPADTQYITLKGNRISTIPSGAFSNLRDLRYLDLASNELQSLPPNIFQGLTSLESLNLSRNRLGRLPSGLLHGLTSLRDLYLDGNVLENLPKDFFQGLSSLRRLYLDSNKFYTLSDKLFGLRGTIKSPVIISNLTSLVELLLNHNGIGQVQHDSFNKMSDLRRLKLNNNNITTLPRGIFRDLKSLRFLSLYKNPFQCTCSLKWLKDWIVYNKRDVTVFYPHLIRCEGPANLRGKSLLNVEDSEFECDYEWGEWSNWNNCSKPCNNGIQSRTRLCSRGSCEGSDTERRLCNTHKCDLGWSSWSVWTPCSVTCSVGYQTRSRSTQCTQSPCQRQLETGVRACSRHACPSYTEWSSWSMCDAQCGQGTQVRTRECSTSHLGVCPEPKNETQDCKIRDCAEWAEWGTWSACSTSCSKGEQTRKRDCMIVHGSKQHHCPGNGTDRQACNIKPCPIDGGWSPWYPWSGCSKTCGLGYSTRYRQCSNPYPSNGGAQCTGSRFEVIHCFMESCSNNSQFTPWSQWSQCSQQCGTGFKSRQRSCRRRDAVTGKYICLGNSQEYDNCEGKNCTGTWGEWSQWTKCLGDCNQGQRFRVRFCVDIHGNAGFKCPGNKTYEVQKKSCKPLTCSQEPVWSSWGAWSACSRTCAGGTRRRRRYCVTHILGKRCPGNQESKSPCNIQPCPIDGGWSNWGEWGKCNSTCNGGIKQRNRTCTEPSPQHNGQACVGDITDKTICNTHQCKYDTGLQSDGPHPKTDEVTTPTPTTTPTTNPSDIALTNKPECPELEMPRNGKYIMRKQKDQHTFVEYKCNDYYRNRGLSTIRYCENNGYWSGYPADCVPDCGEIKGKRRGDFDIKTIRNISDFWPWQVGIEVPMKGLHCGGTLIGDQWVLTAAHCVLQTWKMIHYEEIKVILGTHNSTDRSSKGIQIRLVSKVQHHRDFTWKRKPGVKSDIAILKLDRKVKLTKFVHPVCLPKTKRRKRLMQTGQTGVFVGWGGRERNLLRQIPLLIIGRRQCEQSYREIDHTVTETMFCARYKNRRAGLSKKDSGGGFLFLEKSKRRNRSVNRWVLGGVASWRVTEFYKEKYSVFSDVVKHMNWILKRMGDQ